MLDLSAETHIPLQWTTEVGEVWTEVRLPVWPDYGQRVTIEGAADLWLALPNSAGAPEDGGAPGAHRRAVLAEGPFELKLLDPGRLRGAGRLTQARSIWVAAKEGTTTVVIFVEGL